MILSYYREIETCNGAQSARFAVSQASDDTSSSSQGECLSECENDKSCWRQKYQGEWGEVSRFNLLLESWEMVSRPNIHVRGRKLAQSLLILEVFIRSLDERLLSIIHFAISQISMMARS